MIETLEKNLVIQSAETRQTQSQSKPEIILLCGPMGALIKAEAGRKERIKLGNIRLVIREPLPTATNGA